MASGAHAAIAFDAASVSSGDGTGSSISWSHTVTSGGSDRILVVGVSWRNSGNDTWTVSSVTYNSQALTPIRKDEQFGDPPGSRSTALYYLTDPPTGSAYTIQVNFSGSVFRSIGGAVSFTGVDQSDPVDAENGIAGATGTNPSVTVTTNTDGAWVVDTLCIRNAGGTTSVSGGQTERWNRRTSSESIDGAGSTIGPNSPAGDVTMSWTTGTNEGYSISTAALKPSGVQSFSNTSSITIPDSGPASLYPSQITVSGVTGTVTKVTVSVYDLNHTWADDIDMLLVGPGGQTVMLMSDQGNDDAINLNLTFDDAHTNRALPSKMMP
jgi:hypothetical protein